MFKIFYEILKGLCKNNGTVVTTVLKELNLSTSKMTAWKNGSIPNGKILIELSHYFGVTSDYLLGLSKFPNSEIGINDEGVSLYLKLDENDKAEIRGEMKQMFKADKYKAKEAAV